MLMARITLVGSPPPRSRLPTLPDSSTLTRSSRSSELVVPPPRRVSLAPYDSKLLSFPAAKPTSSILLSSGPFTQKKNPLKNKAVLFRLNPYAKTLRRQELIRSEKKGSVKKSTPGKIAGAEFLKTLHAA
jgi:hypothetical protein